MPPLIRQYRLRRSHRLSGKCAFEAVYAEKLRQPLGPICLCAKPNDLGHPRLGLSVSRRVGGAVKRNRIKRLLREAFRIGQHDWPGAYDVVIVVYPHKTAMLSEYQHMLITGIQRLDRHIKQRESK